MIDNEIRQKLRDINIVSYSGGKDSSVVLQSMLRVLGNTQQKLHIITSDTRMEIPYFKDYLDHTRKHIQNYISRQGINAEMHMVYPDINSTFWVSILGKGYPSASMSFRWCTGKLKVEPISNLIKKLTVNQDFMVFIGVRSAESALRAKIYKQKDFKPNHYAPILDWTAHDVWEYLLTEPCPWGDHSKLLEVYRYSSDECAYGEKQGVCVGNARYGCWACPLQKSNQLELIGLHTNKTTKYQLLKKYKESLASAAKNIGYRSHRRRNGDEGIGPFLVPIRQKLYFMLKDVEKSTNFHLIDPEEEKIIFQHWETDAAIHNKSVQPLLFDF